MFLSVLQQTLLKLWPRCRYSVVCCSQGMGIFGHAPMTLKRLCCLSGSQPMGITSLLWALVPCPRER